MHIDILLPSYLLAFIEKEYHASAYEIDLGKNYRIRSRFQFQGVEAYTLPSLVDIAGTYGTVRIFCPKENHRLFALFSEKKIAHPYEKPKRTAPDIDFPNFFRAIFVDVLSGYISCANDMGKSQAFGIRMFMEKYHITEEMIQMESLQRLLYRAKT